MQPRPILFLAPIEQTTAVSITTTLVNQLKITDTNIRINRGAYTVEAGTNSLQSIKIPADGTYTIKASMLTELTTAASTGGRRYVEWAIVVLRNSLVHRTAAASNYIRGNLLDPEYTLVSYTDDLLADDVVEFRVLATTGATTNAYTIGGGNSFISIMRETVGVGSSPRVKRHQPIPPRSSRRR